MKTVSSSSRSSSVPSVDTHSSLCTFTPFSCTVPVVQVTCTQASPPTPPPTHCQKHAGGSPAPWSITSVSIVVFHPAPEHQVHASSPHELGSNRGPRSNSGDPDPQWAPARSLVFHTSEAERLEARVLGFSFHHLPRRRVKAARAERLAQRSGRVMVGTQSYTLRLSSQNRLSLSRAGFFHGFALGLWKGEKNKGDAQTQTRKSRRR